jgi:2-isopropylmalate synthase
MAVHFHNDLGLAVANTLAAIENGVSIVQCTVNGLGERAGNTSLEELVMALKVKKDHYKARLHINTKELLRTSRLVSRLTGIDVSANKAVVGRNVFASEAGIHQAALLKSRATYEIIKPEEVGRKGTRIVLGRHSGKKAVANRIKELGIKIPRTGGEKGLESVYKMFKELASTKKVVEDSDLRTITKKVIGG